MTQVPYELDLRDLMDARYGVGAWTYRTDVGVGTDASPAIADGVATIHSTIFSKRGSIIVPPTGNFLCNTSPGDLSGITLKGPCGSQGSKLICNMSSGAFLLWSGAGGVTGGGIQGLGILLEEGLGNTNTYGIMLKGNAKFQADQTIFDDIYMTAVGAKSFWWDCVHMDASARTTPQGCRHTRWTGVMLFNAHNIGAYFNNPVELALYDFGTFTGTGPSSNQTIITGGAADVSGLLVNSAVSVQGTTSNVYINGTRYS